MELYDVPGSFPCYYWLDKDTIAQKMMELEPKEILENWSIEDDILYYKERIYVSRPL